jgi:predicted AAA+ superfamily ATPase
VVIKRTIQPYLLELFEQYPIVTITGPRQSGKTTLCRTAFPALAYVNLESPDNREFASQDPRGFLRRYRDNALYRFLSQDL